MVCKRFVPCLLVVSYVAGDRPEIKEDTDVDGTNAGDVIPAEMTQSFVETSDVTSSADTVSTTRLTKLKETALLIIDVQDDFVKGGSLAVNDGLDIVQPINDLITNYDWSAIAYTMDTHPTNHISFNYRDGLQPLVMKVDYTRKTEHGQAATAVKGHVGQDVDIQMLTGNFATGNVSTGNVLNKTLDGPNTITPRVKDVSVAQPLFPPHCVINTPGQQLVPLLLQPEILFNSEIEAQITAMRKGQPLLLKSGLQIDSNKVVKLKIKSKNVLTKFLKQIYKGRLPAWTNKFFSKKSVDKKNVQVFTKGLRDNEDAFGAFETNPDFVMFGQSDEKLTPLQIRARRGENDLGNWLDKQGAKHLVIVGLALDYCVKTTAQQALARGFKVTIITDATKPIDTSYNVKSDIPHGVNFRTKTMDTFKDYEAFDDQTEEE